MHSPHSSSREAATLGLQLRCLHLRKLLLLLLCNSEALLSSSRHRIENGTDPHLLLLGLRLRMRLLGCVWHLVCRCRMDARNHTLSHLMNAREVALRWLPFDRVIKHVYAVFAVDSTERLSPKGEGCDRCSCIPAGNSLAVSDLLMFSISPA